MGCTAYTVYNTFKHCIVLLSLCIIMFSCLVSKPHSCDKIEFLVLLCYSNNIMYNTMRVYVYIPWLSRHCPYRWDYCTKNVANRSVSIPYSQKHSSVLLPKPVPHHCYHSWPTCGLIVQCFVEMGKIFTPPPPPPRRGFYCSTKRILWIF